MTTVDTKPESDRSLAARLGSVALLGALIMPGCSEGVKDAQGNRLSFPVRTAPNTQLGEIDGRSIYLVDVAGQPCVFSKRDNGSTWIPHQGYGQDFKVVEQVALPGDTKLYVFSVGSAKYHLFTGSDGDSLAVAPAQRTP